MSAKSGVTRLAAFLFLLAIAQGVAAIDDQQAPVVGHWLTETMDGIIEILPVADGKYEGRIVGGNNPQRADVKNPDPALRSRLLRGQVILRDLRHAGDGKWSGGTIYDPDSGRTYKCVVTLVAPDRLKVRGFIGFSLLGRSQVWTRYLGTSMDLPPAR